MKKFVSIIICFCLVIQAFSINAFASEAPCITVSSTESKPGEEVDITVSLENNPGISAATLSFDYDKTRLNLESVSVSTKMGGQYQYAKKLVWLSRNDVSYNGNFVTLHFKVLDTALPGDATVNVTYNSGDICNSNEEDVNFAVNSGKISIIENSVMSLQVGNATVTAGDDFEVPLSISDNAGICSMVLGLVYNSDVMTFNGARLVEDAPGQVNSKNKIVWINGEDYTGNGDFIILSFSALDNASGSYTISLSYNNGDISNYDEEDVNPEIAAGSVTINSEDSQIITTVDTGTCGSNLTWTLYSDGNLYVSGSGEMSEKLSFNIPEKYRSSVKNIIINSGVTSICDNAFSDCTNLKSVKIPSSIATIEENAFYGCEIAAYYEKDFSLTKENYGGTITWVQIEEEIKTAAVSVGSNLSLNVSSGVLSPDVTSPTMRFTMNGKSKIVDGTQNSNGTWSFENNLIYANNMNDTVTMELMDGDEVLSTQEYSVKDYCDSLYNSSATDLGISEEKFTSLKTFIADMLEYGAMTQIYTGHNTDDLSNSLSWVTGTKTATFEKPTSNKAITVSAKDKDNKITAATIVLNDSVEPIFYVKADTADTLRVYDGTNTIDYSIADYTPVNGYYVISVGKLTAKQLDTNYTVSLMTSGEIVHQITYSVNSYIASKCNDSDNNLANLVKALYNYGKSAKKYDAK